MTSLPESLDAWTLVGAVTFDKVGGLMGEGWQTIKVLENTDNKSHNDGVMVYNVTLYTIIPAKYQLE